MKRILALSLLCAVPAIVSAQPAAVLVAARPVDPARLAAAHAMLDTIMPPGKREAMIRALVEPTLANMRGAMEGSPAFARLFAEDPRAKTVMADFITRQTRESMGVVFASFPRLIDAMALAYARAFNVPQLDSVAAFYRTPTGQAFIDRQAAVATSPEVMAAQREMMTAALTRVQQQVPTLVAELQKLQPAAGK